MHSWIADWSVNNSSRFPSAFYRFGIVLIWFELAVFLIVAARPWFDFKTAKNLVKFVAAPLTLLSVIFMKPMLELLQGGTQISLVSFMFPIELALITVLIVDYWMRDYKDKFNWKDLYNLSISFVAALLANLPCYLLQVLFGYNKSTVKVLDFTPNHRILIYLAIILPVVIYFVLRNKKQDVINYSMFMLACGTCIGFSGMYSWKTLTTPWNLPIHLCNTAMFLMPLCVIFKPKRLFYFTYFINVAGAVLAMLMPNYSSHTNLYSIYLVQFWYNHWIAFFMPLLCVALKMFDRPKIKQFWYSMGWFFVYYAIALFLNVYYTALGKNVDYFFLNSDYIVNKLGDWAIKIFERENTFVVGGLTLTFHLLYQGIFFAAYILIGFACWFIYELFFTIADNHFELHEKLRIKRLDKIALKMALEGRSLGEPMTTNAGIKFELKKFSKKYSTSKVYAVKDASFTVHGGEIFGFLGPNGAGKSTIIKSTVGIQPISEGNIEICGYDVKSQPVQAKSLIGYVPDHYALYEKLTGREYINYIADIYLVSKEERDARIEKYIELFQLKESIDNKIKTYSHGMKQKITIMSALVHNPKVWILDEPLTGLDPTSIFQVKMCMKLHAAEGNIVFFSSHIIDIVEKLCDRVAIIKKGQIMANKTVKEIEESGKTLEQFYLEMIGEEEILAAEAEIEEAKNSKISAKKKKKR
ncbi:MAG: YwaF family protein [Bacilli bacterium]|nr:YwaF family protein [Bacilli bacterium]